MKLAKGEKKTLHTEGQILRITADSYSETMQAKRQWNDMFKMLRGKKKNFILSKKKKQNIFQNKK